MSIHNKLRITLVALFVFIVGLVGLNRTDLMPERTDLDAERGGCGDLRCCTWEIRVSAG